MSQTDQIKCPNCGANLHVVNDASYFFCQYCGTRIETDLSHREIIHRDETEIEKARLKYKLEMAKIEREREKERLKDERDRIKREKEERDGKISWIILGILFTLAVIWRLSLY